MDDIDERAQRSDRLAAEYFASVDFKQPPADTDDDSDWDIEESATAMIEKLNLSQT